MIHLMLQGVSGSQGLGLLLRSKGFGGTPRSPLAAWLLPPHAQGWPGGIHLRASAGPFAAGAVWCGRKGMVTSCDTFGPESSNKGFVRRRSVPQHMITLDVSFHWGPRSSSFRKGLALPEASSENKGEAVN